VRKKPPAKPKLDPFIPVIDGILGDEHGFTGGITIVNDYVAGWRQRTQEMFVPPVHPPGHAQADFGERNRLAGARHKIIIAQADQTGRRSN
jgi:hypothetical protein